MKLPYPLYWAGSSLEFTFTGSELHLVFDVDFSSLEPWISAELNGAPLLRMPLERGNSSVCLFRGMTPGVPKHVRVFKETQPITDDPLRPQLERAVERFGDAWYLPLPAVTAETMGPRQHPGPLCHKEAAEVTANFLRTIL